MVKLAHLVGFSINWYQQGWRASGETEKKIGFFMQFIITLLEVIPPI